jgi:hypothetical protein
MGKKQRREMAAALTAVPENESRVILATGSYVGEGFDDARLDTLFLAMPISWSGADLRERSGHSVGAPLAHGPETLQLPI